MEMTLNTVSFAFLGSPDPLSANLDSEAPTEACSAHWVMSISCSGAKPACHSRGLRRGLSDLNEVKQLYKL